jgi:replication factor C subunit 2/4
LIILDEADSMTNAAQSALRRTMEKESRATRFCLICNYVSRIIAPIASRCAKFRFKPLAKSVVLARLGHIAELEGLQSAPGTAQRLHEVSEGDLRQCITLFQSLAKLKAGEMIESADVDEVTNLSK